MDLMQVEIVNRPTPLLTLSSGILVDNGWRHVRNVECSTGVQWFPGFGNRLLTAQIPA